MSRAGSLISQTSTLNCAGKQNVYFSGTLRSDDIAFLFLFFFGHQVLVLDFFREMV